MPFSIAAARVTDLVTKQDASTAATDAELAAAVATLGAIYAPVAATWITGTAYKAGQMVVATAQVYQAVDNHTAGATFAGDVAHWTPIAPGEVLSASRTSDVSYATDGTNQVITGLSVTFAATDRPHLILLHLFAAKHTVAQTMQYGIRTGTTDVGAAAYDLLANKYTAVHVMARIPAGTISKTYFAWQQAASAGTATVVCGPTFPALMEVIRL